MIVLLMQFLVLVKLCAYFLVLFMMLPFTDLIVCRCNTSVALSNLNKMKMSELIRKSVLNLLNN